MMEPAELPPMAPRKTSFPNWAITGCEGRKSQFLSSIYLSPPDEEVTNLRLMRRWQEIQKNEVRVKTYFMEGARYAVVGFGSAGRVALSAVRAARAEGIPVGLVRPVTVAPFPAEAVLEAAAQCDGMLVVEMNGGMMLDDVLLHAQDKAPVEFYGRMGGMMPYPEEILAEIRRMANTRLVDLQGHPRDRWLARFNPQAV